MSNTCDPDPFTLVLDGTINYDNAFDFGIATSLNLVFSHALDLSLPHNHDHDFDDALAYDMANYLVNNHIEIIETLRLLSIFIYISTLLSDILKTECYIEPATKAQLLNKLLDAPEDEPEGGKRTKN